MNELEIKQKRINDLLEKHKLDGLLLHRVSSFAWATCGASSYINTASSYGEASILLLPPKKYIVTNNIEATRLEKEERLNEKGWEFLATQWHENSGLVGKLIRKKRIGSDTCLDGYVDLSFELARIRASLTTEEGQRFRALGRLCAEAMNAAAHNLHPGQTEHEIAGILSKEVEGRGVQVIVNLIATDERIFSFRHPLPTDKKLQRYALLIICGRWKGLVCSITRLVHFGHLPKELQKKSKAVSEVDTALIAATRPGVKLGEIFQIGVNAYNDVGFPDEWKLHHQGGPAGYEPREFIVTPDVEDRVEIGQVYAWNPSITGTKSEDTFLVDENENEILTEIDGWPTYSVEVNSRIYHRPAILEMI
ncbi:MAG: peptidase M24 [Gammaproteobacteria bacterium SG8_11]|nr:MAG: peptidase M24 [Gammaproteobacteria bacterium SG8_11]